MSDDRYPEPDLDDDIEVISILGSGWSFKGLNPNALPGLSIGVNDGGLRGGTDIIVSMDRKWTESRYPNLRSRARLAYIRESVLPLVLDDSGQSVSYNPPSWLKLFKCNHKTNTFSEEAGTLNGMNSGVCAFNLAYQLKPKEIYLFGMDMCKSPEGLAYWHEPYPWAAKTGNTSGGKYKIWASKFSEIRKLCDARSIRVVNCSLVSAIRDFPKRDPREVLVP